MTVAPDDRRLLDRDAPGNQIPAPFPRRTPPEQLPSHAWVIEKTMRWYVPEKPLRERVAQTLYSAETPDLDLPGVEDEDDADVRASYLLMADAALDLLAPLLPETTWRSYSARRDQQVARLESLVAQVITHETVLREDNARLRAGLEAFELRIMAMLDEKKKKEKER
jgi:hypothetical protein